VTAIATSHPTVAIDVAAVARTATPAPLPAVNPFLPTSALEYEALIAAREHLAGRCGLLGFRPTEFLEVALREADRQMWWRDRAEAEVLELQGQITRLQAGHDKATATVQRLREERKGLLRVLFEIVAWAAVRLNCIGSADVVLERIRREGSGLLRHEDDTTLSDRIRQEVANGD
jgi:hypothetical protein